MTDSVETERRFTRRNRCPICGGAESDPRGVGERCTGYISNDGRFARCSRKAGSLPQGPDGLWPWPLFSASSSPEIEATYDYRDEAGRQLFQVVRRRGKKFLQRRLKNASDDPNDPNSWEWSTKGVRMVLYKLPELIAEVGSGTSTIFICEGEKDVDSAWNLGLVATCNPRGAGKWKAVNKQARDLLIGGDLRIVVVQDNDEPGIKHARQVAAALGAAILAPPEPFKDLTDWIQGGATMEVIVAAAEQATKIPVSVATTNGVSTQTSLPSTPPPDEGSGPTSESAPPIKLIQAKGQNAPIAENVARLLCRHPDWRGGPGLDVYSDCIYWPLPRPEPVSEGSGAYGKLDRGAVQGWMFENNVLAGVETVDEGVRMAARRRRFDSLKLFIENLPEWDRIPRLDRWLTTYLGCEDTPYNRMTGKAWLRGCVERAMAPGLLVDIVPILVGDQRTNKNYAIKTLFYSERMDAPWTSIMGKFDPDRLDLKRLATTRWIIHDDEFKAKDPRQIDRIKSWVSMEGEEYLAKYEMDLSVRPRRALLVCSTNESQVLYDVTGNRRWVIWSVGSVDIPALTRDRLQLFAEAKELGLSWREGLDYELMAAEIVQNEVSDPLRERLLRLATEPREIWEREPGAPVEAPLRKVFRIAWLGWVSQDGLAEMLGIGAEKADQLFAVRLGRAVSSIKGLSRRTGRGSGCIRFYLPPRPVDAAKVRRDLFGPENSEN